MRTLPKLIATLPLAVVMGSAVAEESTFNFNVPAQPLSVALEAVSKQTGLQPFYADGALAGKLSPALKGNYSKREAVEKLLADSGLEHTFTGDSTVAVKPKTVTTLKPMTVSGKRDAGEDTQSYSVSNATSANKTNVAIMDTPVNIQVVPKAIIDDQQDIRIDDAITKNVSGVQRSYQSSGDLFEAFTIRGFNTNTATYRNGLRRLRNRSDPANIEQIEVLKGPAAILYGQIQPGGMVNIVTNKALDKPYYSLQQQFGNYDQYRTTATATGPIDKAGTLKYRFDASYQDIGSNKKFINDERVFLAPKLSWTPNDRFEANLELEYRHEKRVNDLGIPTIGNRPASIPFNTYLGDSSNGQVIDNTTLAAFDWAFKLNNNWQIKNRFLYENWEEQFNIISSNGLRADNRTLDRFAITGAIPHDSYATNLDLVGKFDVLGIKNNVLIGGDYYRLSGRAKDNRFACCNGSTAVPPIDILNPTYGIVNQAAINASPIDFNTFERDEWFGLYFQDQITLWDKLHILGGGRYDWARNGSGTDENDNATFTQALANFQSVHVQKFSPRAGLVYQPVQWLSLYGNWTESLGSDNSGVAFGNQILKPEIGEQFEGGFKTEFFDKRLSSTVAYYHLTKTNVKVADPVHNGFRIAAGEARSQGIEVDIKGRITEQFNLVTTYALTDARVTENGADANGLLGKRLVNIPEHQASLWGTYQFTPKFRAGIGGVAVGKREGNARNTYQLPGYVRMDMMAAYVQPIGKSRLTTQLNINNVLDKGYYGGGDGFGNTFTGNPLTVMGSLKLEY